MIGWRWGVVAALAVGCGHPAQGSPPIIDYPDAAADAAPTPMSLVVTLDGVPQPGVQVLFKAHRYVPGGEVMTTTDATGTASASLAAEDGLERPSVTALDPFGAAPDGDELFTFEDVHPGDRLTLTRATPASISISVTAPTDTSGATSYIFHSTCGVADISPQISGGVPGGTISLSGCGPTVDMLVESRDASGQSLGWIYEPNHAVVDGATVSLTGAYQPSTVKSFTYSTEEDVLSDDLTITDRIVTANGVLYELTTVMPISFMNTHPVLTRPQPKLDGTTYVTETVFQYPEAGIQHVVDWGAPSDSYQLDTSQSNLQGPVVTPYWDPSRGGVYFEWTGGTIATDYFRIAVTVGGSHPFTRHWLTPTGFNPVAFDDGFSSYDIPNTNPTVPEFMLGSLPGGYDAIRPNAFDIASPIDRVSGPTGHLLFVTAKPGVTHP